MFHYRPTTSADLTYIKRLNYLTEAFYPQPRKPDLAEFNAAAEFYVGAWNPEGDGIIVFDGYDNPAGAAWFIYANQNRRGNGFFHYEYPELAIAIEAEQRGNGLGRELLRRAIIQAGNPGLSLCVHHENSRARRLYETEGFIFVEDHQDQPYSIYVRQSGGEPSISTRQAL